jgi:hypothetical protein
VYGRHPAEAATVRAAATELTRADGCESSVAPTRCAWSRAELAPLLTEPAGPHPWPTLIPGGRLGQAGSEPVAHTPVDPAVVVEVEVDTAAGESGRFRHGARYLRIRAELHPTDLSSLSSDAWSG